MPSRATAMTEKIHTELRANISYPSTAVVFRRERPKKDQVPLLHSGASSALSVYQRYGEILAIVVSPFERILAPRRDDLAQPLALTGFAPARTAGQTGSSSAASASSICSSRLMATPTKSVS